MMPKKKNDATKSKLKSRSTAKYPLRDIPNAKNAAVKTADCAHKTFKEEENAAAQGSQDCLLLAHSGISTVLQQIDELVVQALQQTSSEGMKEVKQFADFLSGMQTSLKPWVPRLQKAVSNTPVKTENKLEKPMKESVTSVSEENAIYESPKETKWESLVSPSPLVTWRAERETGGKQLFLLTPMHRTRAVSSKCPPTAGPANDKMTCDESAKSISHLDSLINLTQNLPGGPSIKPVLDNFGNVEVLDNFGNVEVGKTLTDLGNECTSPAMISSRNQSKFVAMTPSSKMSPFKSCVLLEPISEFGRKKNPGRIKCTPFPTRKLSNVLDSESSSDSQDSDDISSSYPQFLGIKSVHTMEHVVKVVEETPNWNMSPPKTCVIMEPSDEETSMNLSSECSPPKAILTDNQQQGFSVMKTNDLQCGNSITLGMVECTPMMKEATSSFRMGKRPGENTLKKELWMKFEAASTDDGFGFNSIPEQETSHQGFLDRLCEASEA